MAAGLLVLCTGLALYEPICKRIGGEQASFSPAVNFALAGAGKGAIGHHSLRSVSSDLLASYVLFGWDERGQCFENILPKLPLSGMFR